MKNLKSILSTIAMLMILPAAIALGGQQRHDSVDHSAQGDQPSLSTDGLMAIIGSQSNRGVKGMAHVKDVSAVMASMGKTTTHHFMIAFVDEATGKQIEKGTVALKVTNPDAKIGETVELTGMDGHFGADIVLDMKGEYHFRLGTRLEDGTKRKFHFHYVYE